MIAGGLSALLHATLFFVLLEMDARPGDPRALPVLFIEDFAPGAPLHIATPAHAEATSPLAAEPEPAPPEQDPTEPTTETNLDAAFAELAPDDLEHAVAVLVSHIEMPALTFVDDAQPPAPATPPDIDTPRTRIVEIAPAEQAKMLEHLKEAAQQLLVTDRSEITWQDAGRQFRAVLTREAAASSMDLERIAAQITTTDQGTSLQTQVWLSRLAFSQFSQVVDRWDPNVQLHDDEIIGRFHSNSAFFVGRSANATPKFSGKVTTAARGFRFASGSHRRQQEIFQGGFETSTRPIDFPQEAAPFTLDPTEPDAHVHRFEDDTHITLGPDGSYEWQARRADSATLAHYPIDKPLYLLAGPGRTLFVRGIVDGRVLVYSPKRIVIEGSLTYADDPRDNPASDDYLGLVCDGNVEIAPPHVTGRGDLRIDAAIFARRRFLVTRLDYHRSATLWIYGSLTAGTLSASEPRYATKIEFDPRLDRKRPPGFPSTNHFELAHWDAAWRDSPIFTLKN